MNAKNMRKQIKKAEYANLLGLPQDNAGGRAVKGRVVEISW